MTALRCFLSVAALACWAVLPPVWAQQTGVQKVQGGDPAQRRMDLRWALTRAQERSALGDANPMPTQRQLNADERAQLRSQLREHNGQFQRR